jgi:hypothetical protein
MNAYYRSRDGQVDGPWFEGQLLAMEASGQLSPADQLCRAGTEDWLPADVVMDGIAADSAARIPPPPAKKAAAATVFAKRKRKGDHPLVMLGFILLALILCVVFLPLGLVLLLVAIIAALGGGWVCGACGNKIEGSSNFCPSCAADFRKPPRKRPTG